VAGPGRRTLHHPPPASQAAHRGPPPGWRWAKQGEGMVRGWAANTGANPYWPLRRKRDSPQRGNRGFEHPHAGDRVIVPWRSGVRSQPRTIRSYRIGAVGGGPLGCAGREDEGAAVAGGGDGEDGQPRADQIQHPTPGPTGGMDGTPTPLPRVPARAGRKGYHRTGKEKDKDSNSGGRGKKCVFKDWKH